MRDVIATAAQRRDVVSVEMLRPVNDPRLGGSWNTGERAGFAPTVAADLIARGAARRVERKAPGAPPADKALKGAEVKRS